DAHGRVLAPCGLKRATRAAPDKALVRMPCRCLYHCGVAPRLRRQFFLGRVYDGGGGASGAFAGSASLLPASWPSDCHWLSNAALALLTSLRTLCSTSCAASWNCVFIFFSSSRSIERLTSALTS